MKKNAYQFNNKLLEKLPELMGIKVKDFKERMGVPLTTYRRWLREGVSSMDLLAALINRFHLSFADFIVTEKHPAAVQPKEYYVIPEELWQPVQWLPGKIASLYGENSSTGIADKSSLAKLLGISYQRIDRWVRSETPVTVEAFLNLVNTLEIDARTLINDPNKDILRPVFEKDKQMESERVAELEEEVRRLRFEVRTRNELISQMKKDMEYDRKEFKARLAAATPAVKSGLAMDGFVSAFGNKRGYVFHRELWHALPEVFDFVARDLCAELGIPSTSFSVDNIKVDTAIKVCNHLRMSFMHLIRPLSEPSVIRDKGSYAISPYLFKPIESRMENLRYIFRKETFDLQPADLVSMGIHWSGKESLMKEDGKRSMIVTLADICTTFNIPPTAFIYDPNERKRPAYSASQNETLIENCIRMGETLVKLRKENARLKEDLKEKKGEE